MAKKPISEIISDLQDISKEVSGCNTELSTKIEVAILDLQKLDVPTKTDKFIDRSKKIGEILSPIMKILFEYFKGP